MKIPILRCNGVATRHTIGYYNHQKAAPYPQG